MMANPAQYFKSKKAPRRVEIAGQGLPFVLRFNPLTESARGRNPNPLG